MAQRLLPHPDRLARRDPDRAAGGGRGRVVALGQLPQPAVEALGAAPGQQDLAAALDPQRDPVEQRQVGGAAPGRDHRQLVGAALGAGPARRGQRAGRAGRLARHAHRRAELHQALVEVAGRGAGRACRHHRRRRVPHPAAAARGLDVVVDREHPGHDPGDVAVDQRRRLAERDRRDRAGGVGADARHLAQAGGVAGQAAAEPRDHLGGAAVQVAGARVVAEPGPRREDVVEGRRRQVGDRREPGHPPLPVRDDGRDPGLLQHDLADPDRVGIAGPPPRQVAARAPVVGDDPGGDVGGVGRGRRGGHRASTNRRSWSVPVLAPKLPHLMPSASVKHSV